MNLKIKITIIIILTFIIGIFVGALLNRTMTQNKIKRILDRRNPPHFISFYENIIDPDEDQKKQIKKILEKHSKRLSEIHFNYRDELASAFRTMRDELDDVLTQEQKDRLRRGVPFHPPRPGKYPWDIDIEEELHMLSLELDLTDDQASEIKIILENLQEQAKKAIGLRGWRNMEKTAAEKDESIEEILTEDQKKIYDQIKSDRLKEREGMRRQRRQIMNNPEWN